MIKKLFGRGMIFQKFNGLTKKINAVKRKKGGKNTDKIPKNERRFVVDEVKDELKNLSVFFHGR